MIFGRKRKSVDIEPVDTEEEALEIVGDDAGDHESEVDEELADGTREPLSLDEGEFEDGDLDADELAAEDEVSEDFADRSTGAPTGRSTPTRSSCPVTRSPGSTWARSSSRRGTGSACSCR